MPGQIEEMLIAEENLSYADIHGICLPADK